jgi:hypothetical protein
MACRSFEGAALTVSLSEFLPPGGGVRDKVAEGVGLEEGLPLRRVLVLEYGLEDSRAVEVGGARVERRVGGMARVRARMCCMVGWCRWYGRARDVVAGEVVVEVESSPNAKLSMKLAHSKQLAWCIAPSFSRSRIRASLQPVGWLYHFARLLPLSTVTPHTSRLTLH